LSSGYLDTDVKLFMYKDSAKCAKDSFKRTGIMCLTGH